MPTWSAGHRPKAPQPTRPAAAPSGPKRYGLRRDPVLLSGPFAVEFPVKFDSMPERMMYWAYFTLLGPEKYGVWRYQDPVIAGLFEVARVDFTLWRGNRRIAARVQTPIFHYGAGADKKAYDARQRLLLEMAGWIVVDIPEERFVDDKSGTAAIVIAKKSLRGEEEADPVTSGTSFGRPTRLVF